MNLARVCGEVVSENCKCDKGVYYLLETGSQSGCRVLGSVKGIKTLQAIEGELVSIVDKETGLLTVAIKPSAVNNYTSRYNFIEVDVLISRKYQSRVGASYKYIITGSYIKIDGNYVDSTVIVGIHISNSLDVYDSINIGDSVRFKGSLFDNNRSDICNTTDICLLIDEIKKVKIGCELV